MPVRNGDLHQLARDVVRMCRVPAAPAPRPVNCVAVIGAGTMGTGIANATLPLARVILVDPDPAALLAARERIQRGILGQVSEGLISPLQGRRLMRRLRSMPGWSGDTTTDLVVETVPENLELKQAVLRSIEPGLASTAVWATNTSALPLHEIRGAALRPERVIGLHFFHPVSGSRLVELAAPPTAAPDAVATARGFAVLLGKAVLEARESPGYFTTRVLSALTGEALLLLEEGAPVKAIDDAAERFGFVLGPLALLDHIGLEVAAAIALNLRDGQGAAGGSELLDRLLRAGMRGARSGAGFYTYPTPAEPRPNSYLSHLTFPLGRTRVPAPRIAERLVLRFVNEAARATHKRIVASRADADAASVFALGFPAARGGPFRWAARHGHAEVFARLHRLAERHGRRFLPAATWQLPAEDRL
jgi:3-hydroxyacyl-CoA dehydrogenase / enoyl-CoA hydratase / 3-hydroxybutyryl-CoA epimerase